MEKIILASASARRREILKDIVENFEVIPSSFEENADSALSPEETVKSLASGKAEDVFLSHGDCVVIGADTIVFFNGRILGKPKDEEDAVATLKSLSGKKHSVFTGVCILKKGLKSCFSVKSEVEFNVLSDEFINNYVASGSPMDKAGSYGIQDDGVIKGFSGSYTNVVGLPKEKLEEELKKFIE